MKSRLIEHLRRERKNDIRNTTHKKKGKRDISEEGQEMMEDIYICRYKTFLLSKECYESRKRERINEDDSFMSHMKGTITLTYTSDWFLREWDGREILGEWMKKTSVRSQDQRRMIKSTSHSFPSQEHMDPQNYEEERIG